MRKCEETWGNVERYRDNEEYWENGKMIRTGNTGGKGENMENREIPETGNTGKTGEFGIQEDRETGKTGEIPRTAVVEKKGKWGKRRLKIGNMEIEKSLEFGH